MIAADLNHRRIPSPGSAWKRVVRRQSGWLGSTVRTILKNPRYRGVINWNTCRWEKCPDSGRRIRRERPRSEWITHVDLTKQIVADHLFEMAQKRMRPLGPKESVRGGGKVKYLLSGLLRCDVCDAHYVGANVREYECSTHRGGGSSACSNAVRVTRKRCEEVLLGPIYRGMLMPDRVARMAKELQAVFHDEIRQRQRQAVEAPKAA